MNPLSQSLQKIFDFWYSNSPKVEGKIVQSIDYKEKNTAKSKWGNFETLATDYE